MNSSVICIVLLLVCTGCVVTLDNGLARTPPMGWLTWERFRCNTNCKDDPYNCVSEKLIKEMADRMVADGYLSAGYEYITIDDCWPMKTRDSRGRLRPDPERFPSGIKALADYVHSKGLKFGIYEDFGSKTCAGFPGSEFYMQIDAQTFADWGVDLLKFDGCNSDPAQSDYGYPTMGFFLNKTGRPILYSCEWPLYQIGSGIKPNITALAKTCNMARNHGDISDNWDSVRDIINYNVKDTLGFNKFAGPGFWNDPDMLDIGNYGLSYDQERVQMAMWSIMAAPLIMSNDLRNIRIQSRNLLQNKRVIAINQDRLGIQGTCIVNSNHIQLWKKPLLPTGTFAIAIIFMGDGNPYRLKTNLHNIADLSPMQNYNVTEVFDGKFIGTFRPHDTFTCFINPSGVFLIKLTPLNN